MALTATTDTSTPPRSSQSGPKSVDAKAAAPATHAGLIADYAVLFKVRVSTMVLITSAAGFYLGSLRSGISPFNLGMVKAIFGIAVVTCGASALNQVLERKSDRMMIRTRNRPMAARRISLPHGLTVGFLCVILGSLYLAHECNALTSMLTLLTAVGYVAIYTPLKRLTPLNTFIGAFPGALPPLLGWTAARGIIEWPGVALFLILFLWQFPHFMAIGWMYRDDYARAGIRISATNPDSRYAARSSVAQAVFYATLIFAASLWPFWLGTAGLPYAIAACILSGAYLLYSLRFAAILRCPELHDTQALTNRRPARDLLHVSILYLPLLLAAMMLDAQGRLIL